MNILFTINPQIIKIFLKKPIKGGSPLKLKYTNQIHIISIICVLNANSVITIIEE